MPDQPPRILQVNTFDVGGGSARVAWNLFTAYRTRGYRSWLAVGHKRSRDPDVLVIPDAGTPSAWCRLWRAVEVWLEAFQAGASRWRPPATVVYLAHLLAEPGRAHDYLRGHEEFHHPGTWRLLSLTDERPGIIHAHNLHGGYFDLRALPWLCAQAPVVLTLHDAWLLSGHCAHAFACDRWRTGCGRCPDLTIPPAIRRDATEHNWRVKRDLYANSQLRVATPSRWLMRKVEQSMLAPAVVDARVIPNGVDLSVFRPADRRLARLELGLPEDARVLLFAAESIRDNRWKDYPTLRSAVSLSAERQPGASIIFVGLGATHGTERMGRAEARMVPYQHDSHRVARYYQAADLYVHAAREDTYPTSVLEALACGIPVVATAVGGIPEQIEDGRTGFLVPKGDPHALADRITDVLTDAALQRRLGLEAQAIARHRFDLQRQVESYLAWYGQARERSIRAPANRR